MESFQNISKFIKENDFNLFSDVSDDLICIICKGIMINATSAPCRCRYCYECIKKYLNDKTKLFCPGSAKYCKSDEIDFKRDIHVDSIINSRISKLIVKCPQKSCEFKDELCLIKDHIEICDKRSVGCPYLQLGCIEEHVQLNNMKPHLYDDSFIHNKLLIEYINNFKNDVEILKNNMKMVEDENVKLKEQIINNNLNAERKEVILNEIIERIQSENENMKEEINVLLSDIETLKSDQNNEELKKSIGEMEEKQREFETKIDKLSELTEKNSNKDDLNEIRLDVYNIDNGLDDTNERIDNVMITLKEKEFIWKIENLSEKINKTSQNKTNKFIYSDSFDTHTNGYRMCLYASPNGFGKSKGCFGVFFKLMIGPYDDILPWPCKINVTIQLINQYLGTVYLSHERKYENNSQNDVYRKPSDQSKGLGYSHLIRLDELLRQRDLIQKNQLFIKCITNVIEL